MQNSQNNEIKARRVRLISDGGKEEEVFVIGRKTVLPENTRVYSKSQVAKKTGMSWGTVDKLCKKKILRTTADGCRVLEQSLADYLNNSPNQNAY